MADGLYFIMNMSNMCFCNGIVSGCNVPPFMFSVLASYLVWHVDSLYKVVQCVEPSSVIFTVPVGVPAESLEISPTVPLPPDAPLEIAPPESHCSHCPVSVCEWFGSASPVNGAHQESLPFPLACVLLAFFASVCVIIKCSCAGRFGCHMQAPSAVEGEVVP